MKPTNDVVGPSQGERVDLEALERLVEDLIQPDNCHVLLAIAELRRLRGIEAHLSKVAAVCGSLEFLTLSEQNSGDKP